MADRNPGFEVVVDNDAPKQAQPAQESWKVDAATRFLMTALGALGQRFVIALADLFTLLTVASAFWLWMSIPAPDDRQIIALSIYALFVLAANWIVRARK